MSGIWGSLQSDLLDFVTTIKEDTAQAASKVGVSLDSEDTSTRVVSPEERQRTEKDLARSFEVYAKDPDPSKSKKFKKFIKLFKLESHRTTIAQLVDEEPDVGRYYVELVPEQVQPAVFWGRYFFALSDLRAIAAKEDAECARAIAAAADPNITSDSASSSSPTRLLALLKQNDIQDEEEDLSWSDDDEVYADAAQAVAVDLSQSVQSLKDENDKLKRNMRLLTTRIQELEAQLKAATSSQAMSAANPLGTKNNQVVTDELSARVADVVPPVVTILAGSVDSSSPCPAGLPGAQIDARTPHVLSEQDLDVEVGEDEDAWD